MPIVQMNVADPSPRTSLVLDIMFAIDGAIESANDIDSSDLAELIADIVEVQDDKPVIRVKAGSRRT